MVAKSGSVLTSLEPIILDTVEHLLADYVQVDDHAITLILPDYYLRSLD